ncbi:MAG TPA: S8 family peptidase [Vicinamibacterales bacterium]|nr:S8 family peptidase [Vicinamibacterales bacterium]
MSRKFVVIAALLTVFRAAPVFAAPAERPSAGESKLDRELQARARVPRGSSRVILRLTPGVSPASAERAIRSFRGTIGRRLASVGGQVAYVPDGSLDALGRVPGVSSVSLDRRVQGTLERTGGTIGANWVRENLGFDGTGVGVAIIDSGVANWHDDLGSARVSRFVDFVNFQTAAYDDYGHGTHVAGVIAGDGHDSEGRRSGIAPGATLLVEKVLDASGQGYISNVIAAIDYAIANKDELHIRVLNLSVAAGVYESYNTDPLTLAAKRAVEAGIVVVSAAGNLGKNAEGQPQYGGVGAPGNAPWVITVGASSHNGTTDRSDDTVAGFSSRGPSAIDFQAKPDLVAPGVGIESIAEAGSTLWNTKPLMRLWGTVPTATEPYLSLSGTSMAAPVVTGTIALMLQANPALTPNLVKAVLQFTAETHTAYNGLTQGAGFLNAHGAVDLSRSVATGASLDASNVTTTTDTVEWGRRIIWGNHRVGGGELRADASAWRTDVIWGSGLTPDGSPVVWGTACTGDSECDNIVWGTTCDTAECDNIVWGTECGGADCDSIVWGTACDSAECEKTVWGTASESDNIVWDMDADGENDNIVWGTNVLDESDNLVWGAPAIRRQSRILTVIDPWFK